MSAKKKAQVYDDTLPRPLVTTTDQRTFDGLAKRAGLSEYRRILLYGILKPATLRLAPRSGELFLEAFEKSPQGVGRLIEFLYPKPIKKRRTSLPDFLEMNPEMRVERPEVIMKAFPATRDMMAPDEAIAGAKRELEKRNSIRRKTPKKRKA